MEDRINITFSDAESMLDYIFRGHDLYSPSAETYVFKYGDYCAICVYSNIAPEKARQLDEIDDWWSGSLDWKGSAIYDRCADALEWCAAHCKITDWHDVSNMYCDCHECGAYNECMRGRIMNTDDEREVL